MVICLVSFIQNLIIYIPRFVTVDLLFIQASFQLINFIILSILLYIVIYGKWLMESLKIFHVVFVSVAVTLYTTRGITSSLYNVQLVQSLFLIAMNIIVLLQLIKRHDILIFLSPMFWIAAGTFFYYSMFLLTQSLPDYKSVLRGESKEQKKILLLIIIMIQFIFYIISATVAGNKPQENQENPG